MLTAIILGLAVGTVMALTGAGGGILAIPLLVFGAQLAVAQAAPVGLLAVGMAATLGTVLGLKAGVVRYKAALLIASTGMLLAPLGVWLSGRLDNRWLSILFAGVLLFVAYRSFRQAKSSVHDNEAANTRQLACVLNADTGRFVWTTRCARALAASGSMAGMLSGLLGVGGGFVLVPALKRYTDLAMQSIIPTSLAVIALVAISGVASSALSGGLEWAIALPFSAGTLSGMLAGRVVSSHIAGAQLQKGFAAISAIVAIGMLVKAFY